MIRAAQEDVAATIVRRVLQQIQTVEEAIEVLNF
jgi:hypothetical protein